MKTIYSLQNISKTIDALAERITILNDINMEIGEAQSLAILGSSGSGKSTLLNILAGLDIPSSGTISMFGQNMLSLNVEEKALLRNRSIGFVFQSHHLLPEFSTVENVAMQALVGGMEKSKALDKAFEMLKSMKLEHKAKQLVSTLSGGERQRVAIARATVLSPKVLLADEPTGNLDDKTGQLVVDLLLDLKNEQGMTLIMVTHNHKIASQMEQIFELRSGVLYDEKNR